MFSSSSSSSSYVQCTHAPQRSRCLCMLTIVSHLPPMPCASLFSQGFQARLPYLSSAVHPPQPLCRFAAQKRCARMLSKSGLRWSNVLEPAAGEASTPQRPEADDEVQNLMADWADFTKSPTAPLLVRKLFGNLKALERELGQEFEFGGPRGSLRGRPGAEEDARHRAFYQTLDSEAKLQFFTARQVACRVLGSKGYLCTDVGSSFTILPEGNMHLLVCWLPISDCMCQHVVKSSVWRGVKFWLYMHPKDFLRKNNTGKLLWQVFGPDVARLCIFGVLEQEEYMWDTFRQAGRDHVWCLFPELDSDVQSLKISKGLVEEPTEDENEALHFVLFDGTWSNAKAMLNRLQDHAGAAWGGKSMSCLALNPDSLSVMHSLRPQPSVDRTCTAAAAAQLLRELHLKRELEALGLDEAAEALDSALEVLQEALAGRRRRVGRPEFRVGRRGM